MPSRSRIMVYLADEYLSKLKLWSKQENRPASNLAATILIKAIEEWEKQQSQPKEK
jgi:CopG antitoxin of type II toxin-antitoxin system